MRLITGSVFQSLDGVVQAPGGPTEDPTSGFRLGGWSTSFWDDAMDQAMGKVFSERFDLLLGRKTYELFAAHWPYVGEEDPIGPLFDNAGKYVLTRGGDELPWQNSHRLGSVAEVADLKRGDGPDLLIQGSSTLYPALLAAGLIDRITIMTFPVVLGEGKRLFGDGSPPLALKVVEHGMSSTGVAITALEPVGDIPLGTFANGEPSEREPARQERMNREG